MSSGSKRAQIGRPEPMPDRPGYLVWNVGGSRFELPNKYKLVKSIGNGAYGVVVSAKDEETQQLVAIKKIPNAFQDLTDAKRILREIRLLRHFDHENIIRVVGLGAPESPENFEDVYIISELMETDLHRIIYSKQPLSDDHLSFFIYQILVALKYMHSAGVVHRDLKPSNILLNADCALKLCDFGLARGVEPENGGGNLTEYVVTRWYRAPEVMLSCQKYSKAIDIWAVGCIFAELLGGKPLLPGDDYIHQLRLVCEILGSPSKEDLTFVTSDRALQFMLKQKGHPGVDFRRLFPQANEQALDLLSKMLVLHPDKRITVTEALQHPYLAELHVPEEEPTCEREFDFGFENVKASKAAIQRLMWEDISSYHAALAPLISEFPPLEYEEPAAEEEGAAGGGGAQA